MKVTRTPSWTDRLTRLRGAIVRWQAKHDRSQVHIAKRLVESLGWSLASAKKNLCSFLGGGWEPTERSLHFVEALERMVLSRDVLFTPLVAELDGREPRSEEEEASLAARRVVEHHAARLEQLLGEFGAPVALTMDHELFGQACDDSRLGVHVGFRRRGNALRFYARALNRVVEDGQVAQVSAATFERALRRVRTLERWMLAELPGVPLAERMPCAADGIRHWAGVAFLYAALARCGEDGRAWRADLEEASERLIPAATLDPDQPESERMGWSETDRGRISIRRDVILINTLGCANRLLECCPDAALSRAFSARLAEAAGTWPVSDFRRVSSDRNLEHLRSDWASTPHFAGLLR